MQRKVTQKVYYKEPYLSSLRAKVIDIVENRIVLDKTVAYAEGGGQESDRGVLISKSGKEIAFFDVQKGPGRVIYLEDFPTIQVDTPIYHFINSEDVKYFDIGDEVTVKIDTLRRAKLSLSHSGIHFVLAAIEHYFPKFEEKIYGAKIKEDGARLDFRTTYKFSQEDIAKIEEFANKIISKNIDIDIYPHPKEPEAWFWATPYYSCPCGGTHIDNSRYLKSLKIKRKNLGRNGQRVIMSFEAESLFQERFYS